MPCLNVSTNVNLEGVDTSAVLADASSTVATIIGKPEAVSSLPPSPPFPQHLAQAIFSLLAASVSIHIGVAVPWISSVSQVWPLNLLGFWGVDSMLGVCSPSFGQLFMFALPWKIFVPRLLKLRVQGFDLQVCMTFSCVEQVRGCDLGLCPVQDCVSYGHVFVC